MASKVMDEATREKLKGLLPFSAGSFARVTPSLYDDVPVEFRPVFFLRAFTPETMAARELAIAAKESGRNIMVDALTKSGCVGWENLLDLGTGEEIKFVKEYIRDMLPDAVISSLFLACIEFTYGPTKEEKTGLESLPLPTSEQ